MKITINAGKLKTPTFERALQELRKTNHGKPKATPGTLVKLNPRLLK